MRNKILSILIILMFLFQSNIVVALESSTDATKTRKQTEERSLQQKKSMEEKKGKGSRETTTRSTSTEKSTQKTKKESLTQTEESKIAIEVSLENLFFPVIAELEKLDAYVEKMEKPPHPQSVLKFLMLCKAISKPFTTTTVGVTGAHLARINCPFAPGTIEFYACFQKVQQGLEEFALNNYEIERILGKNANDAIQLAKACYATYGAAIADAFFELSKILAKANIKTDKNQNTIKVSGIGLKDLQDIAIQAMLVTSEKKLSELTHNNELSLAINQIYDKCTFLGTTNKFKCGSSILILSEKPKLYVGSIDAFGEKYFGIKATFLISNSYSILDTLEQAKTNTKYEKFVKEVQEFTERLEQEGKIAEALAVKKKASEIIKSNKNTVAISKLLP